MSSVVRQLVRQLVYTMFTTNNRASCDFFCKEILLKHYKVLEYYKNDCLQKCLLLFTSLLTAPVVKRSHI